MNSKHDSDPANRVIVLTPDGGRKYALGGMSAVFKADGAETGDQYSVSEWRLEPGADGPGAHRHEANHEIFLVVEGTMSFLVEERWIDAPRGSFIRVPPGVAHDFANRSAAPAALFNVYLPGGFEASMPAIVEWFARQDGR